MKKEHDPMLSVCTVPSPLLIQNRIVSIENGFQKAHDHESGIADLLEVGDLLGRQSELIHTRKVRVGSGNNAIVVEHNQLFIGHLNIVEYKRDNVRKVEAVA